MDKEFAEAFKEEIELDEMKWAVGGVYHQEFKNGDKVYFRADSVQKNKRWKGMSVDEFGGRQKKAKNASADEKAQGWETTPKNEIPKGLKEEVELNEFYTVFAVRHKAKDGKRYVIPFKTQQKADKKAKELKSAGATEIEVEKIILKGNIKWKEEVEIEEARKAAKDIGLECQECGKRFRSANPRYGITKCPKCKSTDLDLAYGEEVEIDEKFAGWIAMYGGKKLEIRPKKGEIDSLWDAKKSAIDHFKVPKSKQGLLAIKPAHEEVEIDEMPNRANMEKINSLLKKYSGKFKWRDEVLYVEKGIEKDVTNRMKDAGLTAIIKVSSNPMREARSREDELKLAKAIAAWKKAGGKVKKLPPGRKFQSLFGKGYKPKKQPRQAEEVVREASTYRDKKYGKKKTGKVPPSQKASRWGQGGYGKEEVEVDEAEKLSSRGKATLKKSGYELYHKTFSDAMQHAYAMAKKAGVTVDPDEIDNKVATGPKKPSSGKTNRYILGTNTRKKVHIQVANLDNKRYELNLYIESIQERYVPQDKFFPKVLMDGLTKVIPGVKLYRHSIKHPRSGEKIPGLGLRLSGEKGIRIMVQYDKEDAPPTKGMDKTIVDIDPETGKKEVTDTSFRDSYSVWVNDVGKIWKPNELRWIQTKDFRDPKKVVQFLKTKVKRMKEEVEIDEISRTDTKKSGKLVAKRMKTIKSMKPFASKVAKMKTVSVIDLERELPADKVSTSDIDNVMQDWGWPKGMREDVEEVLDIKNTKMADVIKDFQDSDAPQFKGKSDKKRREMAIAAKLSADRNESVKEDETDDPKSKKKDKINLKPKMDEKMKKYKDLLQGLKEKSVKEDSDKDTPGTQGDNAEWQKKRSAVLKKFGVGSCSALKDENEKKACYKALDDAHVADHEEQTQVKEAVTTGGIEYGEQDWDIQHRLDQAAPYLDSNFAEFHEQGLEGPYLWHGETYFFDRKVGGWYSVTAEDYVDDEISKDLSLAYVKDGMYKRQFAS